LIVKQQVDAVRRQILASIAELESIDAMLREMASWALPERIAELATRLDAAKADAAQIKAMFGPIDPDVIPLQHFRDGA